VAVGWCSTSKKSADRRWSSRLWSPELTLRMSMVTWTLESFGSSATTTAPSMPVNRPRTLVRPK
jgi:hypothetical protein